MGVYLLLKYLIGEPELCRKLVEVDFFEHIYLLL